MKKSNARAILTTNVSLESTSRRTARIGAALALAALALFAAPARAEPEPPLRFVDDLGAPVPGIEVCFQVGGDRRCRALPVGEAIRWPAGATGLWAASPGHGPIWIDRGIDRGDPARQRPIGPVVVPRKAALTIDDLPAGGALAVYRADDRSFDVPLDRLRVIEAERPVLVPSGATVLAITDLAADPAGAPDLHHLDLPPGGSGRLRYTTRAGWSAVVRTGSRVHRRPLPGATVRWIASAITAPRSAKSELAAIKTDTHGLALLSGIEAPIASVEVSRDGLAPRAVHGLIAPPGGLHYQEVALAPGGTVAARVLWRGEPAADVRASLVAEPTDPDRRVAPSEVVFRGRTDAAGRLSAENAPEGRYLLRVSAPEDAEVRGHADLALRVDDRRVTEVEADLHPRTVRGRVTLRGEPAIAYRLHARALQRDEAEGGGTVRIARTAQSDTYTDANGEYTMTLLADGDYLLALHGPELGSIAARPIRVGPGGAEASFRLEAVVVGRAVSARGGVVGGADVRLVSTGAGDRMQVQRTVTMSNGLFSLPVETAGTYRIGATKEGWLGDGGEIRVGPDGVQWVGRGTQAREAESGGDGEIELTLQPLERLRGRVVDAEGRPLAGVRIASCRDAPGSPLAYVGAAESGADGAFEVPSGTPEGAPPPRRAPVSLYASGPGCPLTEVTVEPPSPTGGGEDEEPPPVPSLTIRCDTPPAVLRAHVAFSSAHPLPGERIALRRHGRVLPQEVVDGHLESLRLPRATAEDGHLLLILAPGRWQLHRAGTSPNRIEAGDESGLLGTVALDPWTVTDLYTGSDE